MLVFCVINQKGGVGKTTTADALAAFLARQCSPGKVLAIDLDPQCNLSAAYQAVGHSPTIKDVLDGTSPASKAVKRSERGDILVGSNLQSGSRSKDAIPRLLSQFSDEYECVVIDTPPTIHEYTLSAMLASDALIVPAMADVFSLSAVDALRQTFERVRTVNKRLRWGGVVLTRFNGRANMSRIAAARLGQWAGQHGLFIADPPVRECVAIREAQALGKSIFDLSPNNAGSKDYAAAFSSILKNLSRRN